MAAPDLALVRTAFDRAGEKHFALARRLYPLVFGPAWTDIVLVFAYLKELDDLVDEDRDAARALRTVARHRAFVARACGGGDPGGALGAPECFAWAPLAADRQRGRRVLPWLDQLLGTMAFDVERRGRALDGAALDAYVLELGGSVIHLFAQLAGTADAMLPAPLVEAGSRAYLHADALLDLREDLACGVINIPREDLQADRLSAQPDDPRLPHWVAARAPTVLAHFRDSLALLAGVRPLTLRAFLHLYLGRKRRRLLRLLARCRAEAGAAAAPQALAPSGSA